MSKLVPGVNDLKTWCEQNGRMDLLLEWDYGKNGDLKPNKVTMGACKKVWWECSIGHSYESKIKDRTGSNKQGCPYCSGKRVLKGFNDLKTWCEQNGRMDLLLEWSDDNILSPEDVTHGSHREINWVCSKCGNKYVKNVHSRVRGTGCGVCSGVGVFQHRGKLFEEYPELKDELDFNQNSYEEVKDITAGSIHIIHWMCNDGHSYEMRPVNKLKSKGCPYCTNERVLCGFNDLESWCNQNNRRQILDDWDYEKKCVHSTRSNIRFE